MTNLSGHPVIDLPNIVLSSGYDGLIIYAHIFSNLPFVFDQTIQEVLWHFFGNIAHVCAWCLCLLLLDLLL